jgi:CheY-like chemotaxis protein
VAVTRFHFDAPGPLLLAALAAFLSWPQTTQQYMQYLFLLTTRQKMLAMQIGAISEYGIRKNEMHVPLEGTVVRLWSIFETMGGPNGTTEKHGRRIKVLIADDHLIIRRAVRSVLQSQPHIEVCGEAEDGGQAIQKAKQLTPDVIVLNINMPILNGFEAAREIKTALPTSAIVILSHNADRHFVEEAKKIGVHAYVAKSKAGGALVGAIEAAMTGKDFLLIE